MACGMGKTREKYQRFPNSLSFQGKSIISVFKRIGSQRPPAFGLCYLIHVPDLDTYLFVCCWQVHGHDFSCLACLPGSDSEPAVYASGAEEKVIRVFQAPSAFQETLARAKGQEQASTSGREAPSGVRFSLVVSGSGGGGGGCLVEAWKFVECIEESMV